VIMLLFATRSRSFQLVTEIALWMIGELKVATGGTVVGVAPRTFNGVSIDTRSIRSGEIFVAIMGDRVDGHDFVVSALQKGAGIAVVSRVDDAMKSAGALLVVPGTTLEALEAMGRAARSRSGAGIVAVTGSVGKTSTKEMLRSALSACGETHASAASFNNHWGVPLTLARLPRTAQFGVFEIGMNHAGEITPLVKMVRPQVAVITTIAASHLGHFASLDEIAVAKAEIFSGVQPGGTAVLNRDSPYFEKLENDAQRAGVSHVVGFGHDVKADVRMVQSVLHSNCTCMTVDVMGDQLTLKLGLAGAHMAQNALAVLATVKLLNGDLAKAGLALSDAKPAKGRGVVEKLSLPAGDFVMLDESYNANPASMRAAIELLKLKSPRGNGRLLAVVGDMLELGSTGPDLHRGLANELEDIDLVYAAGPLMKHLWDALPQRARGAYAETSADLHPALLDALRPGDVVMIKGSLGSKMGPVAELLRTRYGAGKGQN
jgi:UDP-N-acetylmuramoyl-tripeptide--D-alanyl-D-alanine ligase